MSITQQLPLQLRVIATIALALLVTAGLSVVPISWHAKSKVKTEMQAALAVGKQVAQNEINAGVSTHSTTQRLEQMIDHFNGDRHLKAELRTPGGTVVAASRLAPPERSAPAWFRRFINAQPYRTTLHLNDPSMAATQLIIEADPTNEIVEAWEDLTTFAGILGLFCLLVLASVSWIVTRAISPIRALLDGYTKIAHGDLEVRITPTGSPELQRLCSGFNDMSDALHKMGARNQRLTRQLEDVQEEERADLARDLHDEVSPLLFAADVDATMISKLAKHRDQSDIEQHTAAIRSALKQLKKTVTLILGRLRPGVLLDQGLAVAIDNLVSTSKQRHPHITFNLHIEEFDAPAPLDSTIFFVVREALANALRHANPTTISIAIKTRQPDEISISIADDGSGLNEHTLQAGFGIRGMSERVARANGTFQLKDGANNKGAVIDVVLPRSAAQNTTNDSAPSAASPLDGAARGRDKTKHLEGSALSS